MIKLSFIIPCYNAQKTIVRCLDSLERQSLSRDHYEIIVVDNNSQDNSAKIINNYKQVKFIKEVRQGRSFARNTGAKVAMGELLAFIDADVYLDSSWAKELTTLFANDNKVGAGQGQIIPCREIGKTSLNNFRYRCVNEETNGSFILTSLLRYEFPMINTAACMYKKSVFEEVNGFDINLERHEDIDLSRRVHMNGHNIHCSTKASAYVIFHGESWLDYIKRSFDDGYYKKDYICKWKNHPKTISTLSPPRTLDFSLWIVSLFIKAYKKKTFHYVFSVFIGAVNAYGRFYGRVRHIDKSSLVTRKRSHKLFGDVLIDGERQNV